MMTIEALFSLLALLIVVAMLAQPQHTWCAGDAVYEQRLVQDVAGVLAKKGTLEGFASWAGADKEKIGLAGRNGELEPGGGAAASFENDLHDVAVVSGRCVEISMGGKRVFSCGDGKEERENAGEIYSTARIAVLKDGFADVHVAVWEAGQ